MLSEKKLHQVAFCAWQHRPTTFSYNQTCHRPGLINSCCELHFFIFFHQEMTKAFCHIFSHKFRKMLIFLAEKVRFHCFSSKPKSSHKFLQASRKHEKNSAWGSIRALAGRSAVTRRMHGNLYHLQSSRKAFTRGCTDHYSTKNSTHPHNMYPNSNPDLNPSHEPWPIMLPFELHLHRVNVNQHAKYTSR